VAGDLESASGTVVEVSDAEDLLVELASEPEDHDELARLAAAGNTDAAAILEELEQ